jgi:hypothetical protein
MKKLLIILSVITSLLFSAEVFAKSRGGGGHVHVNGYTRKDGTYVQPHYRTAPDGIKTNNWSYSGNVNPYTGKVGTNPDSSPNYGRNYSSGGYSSGGYSSGGYSREPVYVKPVISQPLPAHTYEIRDGVPHNKNMSNVYAD